MSDSTASTPDEPIHVRLLAPDAEGFTELAVALERLDGDVQILSVARNNPSDGDRTETVRLDVLTEKQRETVLLALKMGYYSTPREATIGDIADRIGVSESAISQRLRRAECRLVHAVFGRIVE